MCECGWSMLDIEVLNIEISDGQIILAGVDEIRSPFLQSCTCGIS
jgi:hypothetical protein